MAAFHHYPHFVVEKIVFMKWDYIWWLQVPQDRNFFWNVSQVVAIHFERQDLYCELFPRSDKNSPVDCTIRSFSKNLTNRVFQTRISFSREIVWWQLWMLHLISSRVCPHISKLPYHQQNWIPERVSGFASLLFLFISMLTMYIFPIPSVMMRLGKTSHHSIASRSQQLAVLYGTLYGTNQLLSLWVCRILGTTWTWRN